MEFANAEQAEFWSSRAPSWLEMEDHLERISGVPGRLAMDRLSLRSPQRVLDLGCGGGRTTMELAARVSPEGDALGVDISGEMVAAAGRRSERQEVGNVDFIQADLQVHDLGEEKFDAAYSRFGIMFFADPVVAFTNVRRALRRGGELAFVCWQNVFENEWMLVPGMAAMSVLGPVPMPDPEAPGPFSLADPARITTILGDSGFSDVEVVPRNDFVTVDESLVPQFVETSTSVGAVREALVGTDEATRQEVLRAIDESFRSRLRDGRAQVTRAFHLVSAKA